MIADATPWTYDSISERWSALYETGGQRRDITIAWDGGDRTFYLSVLVHPPPNTGEGAPRSYTAPLSLLAATLLLPKAEHAKLVLMVEEEAREVFDKQVIAELSTVLESGVQGWPEIARAHEAMKRAGETMPTVERLMLDVAGAGAWS